MLLKAWDTSTDENQTVYINVIDLDEFIHADYDDLVFVENEEQEQYSVQKQHLERFEIVR